MLPLSAEYIAGDTSASMLQLSTLRCYVTFVHSSDGLQHCLLMSGARRLQLVIAGASIFERARLLTEAIVPAPLDERRHRALRQLTVVAESGDLSPRLHLPEPRSRRLSFVLQATDGAFAKAPQREIARALLGPRRVDVDWSDPRGHLRDLIRRAVRRGRRLVERGYLSLLQ